MTTLVDTQAGKVLSDIESFEVSRNGEPFRAQDFNFWGVTFTSDSNTFYATLSSGGAIYLIRGDAAGRRATVIGQDIECPSLSPDGLRLAFKKRRVDGGRVSWRLAILDLPTGKETEVSGESRSLDDQVEWLDNDQIVYSMPDPAAPGSMTTYVVLRDGSSARLFIEGAYSASLGQP